jgi:hypothetical protein
MFSSFTHRFFSTLFVFLDLKFILKDQILQLSSYFLRNNSQFKLTFFLFKECLIFLLQLSFAYLLGILLGTIILYLRHYQYLKGVLKNDHISVKSDREQRDREIKGYLIWDFASFLRLGQQANLHGFLRYILLILNIYLVLPYVVISAVVSNIFLDQDLFLFIEEVITRYFVFSSIFVILEIIFSKIKLAWENHI